MTSPLPLLLTLALLPTQPPPPQPPAQQAPPSPTMITILNPGDTADLLMGSTTDELQHQPSMDHDDYDTSDETAHKVKLTVPYAMSKYEITNDLFCTVMSWALAKGKAKISNGDLVGPDGTKYLGITHLVEHSYLGTQHGFTISNGKLVTQEAYTNHPVHAVTWFGAIAFCNFLSELHQLSPVYDLATSTWDTTKTGYRLPTEAEWEYAARKDRRTTFAWGDEIDYTYLSYAESYEQRGTKIITTPVGFYDGGKKGELQTHDNASPFGLYDMTGNVWEWCWDWYRHDYYQESPAKDPLGPEKGDDRPPYDVGKATRSWRGCGWAGNDAFSRVAKRWSASPETAINEVGFRVARTVGAE